jgi:hypothetical protein
MGCLFSSSSSEESGDRRRKQTQQEESTLPTPQQTQQSTNTQANPTATPTLTINSNTQNKFNINNNNLGGLNSRVLGTSITDSKLREKLAFQSLVQTARQAFMDISAQRRLQVSPLSPQALALTAQCEALLSFEKIPNIKNGFFEAKIPYTMFTSMDTNPSSNSENSVDNIVNSILEPPNYQALELAYACSQEACFALVEGTQQVTTNSLVISLAEFEDNDNSN